MEQIGVATGLYAFIAKTPLSSRVRLDTYLVVMCTTSQCKLRYFFPESARKEHNLHCDVVHVTTKWISRLVLDHAIVVIQTSR